MDYRIVFFGGVVITVISFIAMLITFFKCNVKEIIYDLIGKKSNEKVPLVTTSYEIKQSNSIQIREVKSDVGETNKKNTFKQNDFFIESAEYLEHNQVTGVSVESVNKKRGIDEDATELIDEDATELIDEDITELINEDATELIDEDITELIDEDITELIDEDAMGIIDEEFKEINILVIHSNIDIN